MTSCGPKGCLLQRIGNGAPIRVKRGFPPGVRSDNAPAGECNSNERNYPCPRFLKEVHVPVRRGFPVGFEGHDSSSRKETNDDEMEDDGNLVGEVKMVGGGDEVLVGSLEWDAARAQVMEVINLFRESLSRLSKQRELTSGRTRSGHAGIHLEVAKLLREQGKSLNTTKQLGTVLGVEVGDRFQWRAELTVVGLHHQSLRGIDYIQLKDGKPLATSIVNSGRYANGSAPKDCSFSDSLTYVGEGGKAKGCGKVIGDQKLQGGNLALKNSMKAKTPVRVIRKMRLHGTGDKGSVFVYDGLYFVESYSREQVFKFFLKRIPEQPMVSLENLGNLMKDSTQGNKRRRRKRKFSSLDEQVVLKDITQGVEGEPIPVRNALDNELPQSFVYVADMIYPEYHDSRMRLCCDCVGDCSSSSECLCLKRNGGELPYNHGGRLINAKQTVYECGPSCRCSDNCINRVSQHGIHYRLELFKTDSKGWGVRSQSRIPCGSFICEYIGLVIDDEEAEQRIGEDDYLFDIGLNYGKQKLGGKRGDGFSIDASSSGNVSRFINHSCSPNLFVQNVLYDHDDEEMPHIMLFAMEDISPLEEFTYDYNYKPGEVCDANGNTKMKPCHCGSIDCTGRIY